MKDLIANTTCRCLLCIWTKLKYDCRYFKSCFLLFWLDNSLRIDFTLNGDTLRITKDYGENNIERIEKSITGDTLSYEVSLGFQDRKVEREIEANRSDFPPGDYYYGESKFENRDTRSDLVLNPRGDTLGFDQYIDGHQHGLQVFGFNDQYGSEEIKFRFLWKNDTMIEILNENILFLKKNSFQQRTMFEEL